MDHNTTWRTRRGSVVRRIAGPPVLGLVLMLAVAWWGQAMMSTASADEAVVETAARLTFEQPTTNQDTVSLQARLTTDDGQPLARARVEFFVTPDFFGERPVTLQTAFTNADGLASLTYVPTWEGAHRVTAIFGGNSDYQPDEATTVMTVSGVASPHLPDADSLAIPQLWAAPAVTAGAAIVWLLIVGVLVRVGWGVWRERDQDENVIASQRTTVAQLPGGTDR